MGESQKAVHPEPLQLRSFLHLQAWKQIGRYLGPGVVAGGADSDPAAIATFSIVGATTGFSQLWLLALTTPMETAVQIICGLIGSDTRQGLASLLKLRFGWTIGGTLAVVFLIGNFAALTADTLIFSNSMAMITGIPSWYFPVLLIFLCWHLLTFHNFRRLIGILVLLNLSFLVYAAAAIVTRPDWSAVLAGLFWPFHSQSGVTPHVYLTTAAALLGSRLSPYMFFWEASAETEQFTEVRVRGQTQLDVAIGMILSNLVGFFIIVTTGATLFVSHTQIATVHDAALALAPLAGRGAALFYTLGVIGSGLIAIPVLSATSAYVLAETMNWPRGLRHRPWQVRRFYLCLSAVLLTVAVLSYLPIDTVRIAFWSQVLWGVLAPVILVLIFFLERRRSIRRIPVSRAMRAWLGAAIVLGSVIAILSFTS